MTNLLATIFITITTNWTDVQRITPIVPENERTYAIYRESFTVQRGTILTNTMARIKFEDRDVDVLLKSIERGERIERTIGDLQRIAEANRNATNFTQFATP